jgi:hypothetical protein
MIKQQEWADWLRHPVTQAVIQHLEARKDSLISDLLNLDIASKSIDELGIHCLALRSALNGLGEFLDVDDLQESIVEVLHES